jgi:hypothetical protein
MPKRQVFLIMVNAKEFFESAPKQIAVRFIVSRFVRNGDTAVFNAGGLNVECRVERDGWYLPKPYYMVTDNAPDDLLVDPKQVQHFKLPEDLQVQKVEKDHLYAVGCGLGGLLIQTSTCCAGYLFKQPVDNGYGFIEEAAYAAIFGDQQSVEGQTLVAVGAPVSCVVLEKDTTFDFINETFLATTGKVLYENPSDPDGYTVTSQMRFFQDYLILR